MSGIAGRTNYSDWEKKTSSLLSDLENETQQEIQEAKEALGQNGKYAYSEAEATERQKEREIMKKKKILSDYKERELGVVQILPSLLFPLGENDGEKGTGTGTGEDISKDSIGNKESGTTKYVTRDFMEAGKRVLNITNTIGPGNIVLTQDLSNLESNIPTSVTTTNATGQNPAVNKLSPKSYPQDAENAVPEETKDEKSKRTIRGLIKVSLTNLHNCTVTLRSKVITGLLEVSHCSNVIIKLCKESTIVTIQADLSNNLDIQFHDAPSGKCLSSSVGLAGESLPNKFMYWGEDKDDRIFHAGVSDLKIGIYRDGFLENETSFDYKKHGNAKAVGNASAEEEQFVSSVVGGDLITEKVLRQGSATGTTVAGGVGGSGGGGGARAMTEREMKEVEKRKEAIRKAVDERLGNGNNGGIKIINKEGNEIPAQSIKGKYTNDDDDVTEEVFTSMKSSDIDSIVKDCEAQKAKGNESFVAGEYAQAVLLYTLALDRAAELPDATSAGTGEGAKQLFPRHIVLSNRAASFLKLGHHEKALQDGTEAERLEPTYCKGIFRKGLALHAMGRYQEALTALSAALKIEPKNKQIKQALQFAEVRFQQEMRKRMDG